jgi:hypothetical protein
MKNVLTCWLLAIPAMLFGQDSITNDLLTTKKFRYGIFRTYSEFKTNSPSIEGEFKITEEKGMGRYRLFSDNDKKVRKVYGFSDGRDLYVNAKTYDQTNYFVKVTAVGPITYFEDEAGKRNKLVEHTQGYGFGLIGMLIAEQSLTPRVRKNPGMIIYLPDEEGYAYALDEPSLSSIFKEDDPELYKKYKEEKDQRGFVTLLRYVVEFNQRWRSKR